jgi:hypothetical protein
MAASSSVCVLWLRVFRPSGAMPWYGPAQRLFLSGKREMEQCPNFFFFATEVIACGLRIPPLFSAGIENA